MDYNRPDPIRITVYVFVPKCAYRIHVCRFRRHDLIALTGTRSPYCCGRMTSDVDKHLSDIGWGSMEFREFRPIVLSANGMGLQSGEDVIRRAANNGHRTLDYRRHCAPSIIRRGNKRRTSSARHCRKRVSHLPAFWPKAIVFTNPILRCTRIAK